MRAGGVLRACASFLWLRHPPGQEYLLVHVQGMPPRDTDGAVAIVHPSVYRGRERQIERVGGGGTAAGGS